MTTRTTSTGNARAGEAEAQPIEHHRVEGLEPEQGREAAGAATAAAAAAAGETRGQVQKQPEPADNSQREAAAEEPSGAKPSKAATLSYRLPSVGLRRLEPYWYNFETQVKMRWIGRELIEVLVTEFRDRTRHFYTWAIHNGICTVNGQRVSPRYRLQTNDRMTNRSHRHEPPVTAEPIRLLHHDEEQGRLVVSKPGGMPIHAAARYARHTLLEMVKSDLGIPRVLTSNRLDRLTSGIMVLSTRSDAAARLARDFELGLVRKAYVCRVVGRFPDGEVSCREPLLSLDRQTTVNVVHPSGKPSMTLFQRLSYDADTDTSVVFCQPITGRTHQIRVHAQWLGHAIVNDPIYNHAVWRRYPPRGFARLELTADRSRRAPEAVSGDDDDGAAAASRGCEAADAVIEAIKASKDESEDWSRCRDERRFRALNRSLGIDEVDVAGPNGGDSAELRARHFGADVVAEATERERREEGARGGGDDDDEGADGQDGLGFCSECQIPLLPDPSPESMFIYLHAIKYETDEWSFSDTLPWWAREDWRSGPTARDETRRREGEGGSTTSPTTAATTGVDTKTDQKGAGGVVAESSEALAEAAARLPTLRRTTDVEQDKLELVQRFETKPLVLFPRADATAVATADEGVRSADVAPCHRLGLSCPAVFEVFRGLEEYPAAEIHELLGASGIRALPQRHVQTNILSGHVVVPPLDGACDAALRAYVRGDVWTAKDAYLGVGTAPLAQPLTARLHAERLVVGSREEKRKKHEEKRKRLRPGDAPDSGRYAPPVEVERLEDALLGTTLSSSEAELLRLVRLALGTDVDGLKRVLEDWNRVRAVMGLKEKTSGTYRATVHRSHYLLPFLSSTQLERFVGEVCWEQLNGADVEKDDAERVRWKVDLRNADLEVVVHLVPALGTKGGMDAKAINPAGSVVAMVLLPAPTPSTSSQCARSLAHRPDLDTDLVHGGTALKRYRAQTLALALPLPLPDVEVDGRDDGDVAEDAGRAVGGADTRASRRLKILEPCAGTGAIPVELAASLRRRGIRTDVFASDIHRPTVERLAKVVKACGFGPADGRGEAEGYNGEGGVERGQHSVVERPDTIDGGGVDEGEADVRVFTRAVDAGDPVALADFVGGEGTVDGIVTDLPWGRRAETHSSVARFYPRLMRSLVRVLKPGASALVMTAEHKALLRVVTEHEGEARKLGRDWRLKVETLWLAHAALDDDGRDVARRGGDRDGAAGGANGGAGAADVVERPSSPPDRVVSDADGAMQSIVEQARLAAEANGGLRSVDCGYVVWAILLRKVPGSSS